MTKPPVGRDSQKREVELQVRRMFGQSRAFAEMPRDEQERILANTTAIVDTMAQNKLAQAASGDPYAVPFVGEIPKLPGSQGGTGSNTGGTPAFTGGAQPGATAKLAPQTLKDFGAGLAVGVGQAGELLRQVNFPAFVGELIQGVFQAVVDASIKQMKAYGELVQSVTMSLNDFRDANVTENQARDHLVGKFPQLMQVNITDAGPRVGMRPDANTDALPDIAAQLGLGEEVSSLDDDMIEEQLVPAARNDLARSRQSLLATMVLMGINRIVVTDGKINAKLNFQFRAKDTSTVNAQLYDYKNFGDTRTTQSTYESGKETGENYTQSRGGWSSYGTETGASSRWSKGAEQTTETPAIYLTSVEDSVTNAELEASAKLSGEVSLNFKSETLDLNKLTSADEIFKLERVRSAGRGAPGAPVGSPQAGDKPAAAPAPETTTPAR